MKRIKEIAGFGTDYKVLTFSFDHSDGPTDLTSFAERWEMDGENWKIVSADSAAIGQLLNSLNFKFEWNEELGIYEHDFKLAVISSSGRIIKIVNGLGPNKYYLELGLEEAGDL